MTPTNLLMRYARLMATALSTCMGSIGVYALVCSSLHPHPDAALMAIIMLTGATALTRWAR